MRLLYCAGSLIPSNSANSIHVMRMCEALAELGHEVVLFAKRGRDEGAFFQDTGGNWMFVVSDDGSEAVRRSVRLGRRNSRSIEVLDGLEVGEAVVTSPYSSFKEMDRLKLTKK